MTDETTLIQRQNWNAVAGEWSQHFDWNATAFRPVINWMCDATALAPGQRVLDVACGTGMPALAAAARVHPGGHVIATDISGEMLRVTAERALAMAIGNIEFLEMDAHELQLGDRMFDAVTCAFGLMFCADPLRVLAGVRRVLKPGGRFAFTTWAPPAENTFVAIYGRAVAQVLLLPRYDRSAPGPFRLTDAAELEAKFRSAGFRDVDVTRRPQPVVYESVSEYEQISAALTPGLTWRLRQLAAADRVRLSQFVQSAAAPYVRDGAVHLLATPLCVSGSA